MSQDRNNHFDQAAATWDDNPTRIAMMKIVGTAILREARPDRRTWVLDYGCGTGLIGLFLLPHVGSVTGADSSSGMLEVLDRKVHEQGLAGMQTLQLDLEHDPVPAHRYDLIVSNMTLHHIADTDKVLAAWSQMLTDSGTLCVTDLLPDAGLFHPAEVAHTVHHHGFDPAVLAAQLAQHGFRRTKSTTVHTVRKPAADGQVRDFPVFLLTACK